MLAEAAYYLRMARGLAEYQRSPVDPDPVAAIRAQFARREETFLALARYVLSRRDHFYSALFRQAGVEYADLANGVARDGLRPALANLLRAGVCVTHDEFKGRRPIVRGGREIPSSPADWVNPAGRGKLEHSTSGSTGKRFTTMVGTAFLRYREGYDILNAREWGKLDRPRVLVSSVLPSIWPIRCLITWHRLGMPFQKWFALGTGGQAAHYRVMTRYMVEQTRLLGAEIPRPEFLPPNDFAPVAEYLAALKLRGPAPYLRASVSPATRVAAAARDRGLDISGTVMGVSGEPLTDAKRQAIESTGAQVFSKYLSSEFGAIGYGCRQMQSGNRIHLFDDALLMVAHRRPGADFQALYGTSLAPDSPRILINVEVDDAAVVEPVDCDCEYGRTGLAMQARDIFSYGKVTGQAMTVEAKDLLHILEQALPQRFGGSPGDFQLAETEGRDQTQMVLRVSPRLKLDSAEPVREQFLAELKSLHGGHLSARVWKFTGGLRVEIAEPELTYTGKAHPVRFLGAGTRTGIAGERVE